MQPLAHGSLRSAAASELCAAPWAKAPRQCSRVACRAQPRAADQENAQNDQQSKSISYSKEMQLQMGSPLHYRHELGINYTRIAPDIIVGSCLQTAADVDLLAEQEGVTLVFCLQEDSDLRNWSLDVGQIQQRCEQRGDIKHVRHPIRDFDPQDLRRKLPQAISLLAKEHRAQAGTVYIHCTAGLGRAPATAVAYQAWVRQVPVDTAMQQLRSVRPCNPRIEAVRSATADLLLGNRQVAATIAVQSRAGASVQIAGLDHGWEQPHMDMDWDSETQRFLLSRPMYPGTYPFKLVIDGQWLHTEDYPTTQDGAHTNNFLEVVSELDPELDDRRLHYSSPGVVLTRAEQEQVLESLGIGKEHHLLHEPEQPKWCLVM